MCGRTFFSGEFQNRNRRSKSAKELFSDIELQKSSANIFPYNSTKKLPINGTFNARVTTKNSTLSSMSYADFKGMGKLKNFKQKLHINPETIPIQQATRRIPFQNKRH